jgi:Domain of unknown function (DUF4224)
MFLTPESIAELTGYVRPSAQARWLSTRRYKFERRADGSITLRQAELDAHTVSKPGLSLKKAWEQDLSALKELG